MRLFLLLTCLALSSCSELVTEETLREDLNLTTYRSRVTNGLSPRIDIVIPPGVDSFMIEVRGQRGIFSLAEFKTPQGESLIENESFSTRAAYEMPGVIDWLYPNTPTQVVEEGTYQIVISGTDAYTTGELNEDVDVLVYTPQSKETCGLHIDFLVDDAALALETFDGAVERIVTQLDTTYRQVGITIADYQTYRVNMQSSDIDLASGSALNIVDEVLNKTVRTGAARDNSLHILLVRSIGGSDNPDFRALGYAMGIPGPYAPDRGTSAVLGATGDYGKTGQLDADGLASSLTHEIGHFLGLYHTSEEKKQDKPQFHDPIEDTPQCNGKSSCDEDFLRNVMSSSFWLPAGTPGSYRNRFTAGQGKIMRGHPLCEPMAVQIIEPDLERCTKECDAPNTCSVKDSMMTCQKACNPTDATSCESGTCEPDDFGTYVCM